MGSIDDILTAIGPFNKYQWYLMAMLAYCMLNLGLQMLTMTFIANDPGWSCSANSSACNHTSVMTSTMDGFKDRCGMERRDWGYPEGASSIVTEFDLFCDRAILGNIATSMVFAGWLVGNLVFGYVSDKWGRKKALLISMTVMSIAGVVSSFVKTFWLFTLLKAIVGSGIGGAMVCIFILNAEFIGPKKRAFGGTFIWNFMTVGVCLVSLLAYLIKDWKYLNLATSVPGLLIIPLYFLLPESVRWLLVNDKSEEAEKILKKVARVNKREYPSDIKLHEPKSTNESGNVIELFKTKSLTIATLVSMVIWFTCSMVSYGVSLSTGRLGGDIHLVFFLTSIVSIPGNFTSSYVLNRFGRKSTLVVSLFGCAGAMIGAALMPTTSMSLVAGKVTLAMVGKFLIGISFNAAYFITFELLPTTLRNVGMGLSSSTARIGSFSSSYVIYLNRVNSFLPFVVFGAVAIFGASLSFILPETKGKPTRETVSDDQSQNKLLQPERIEMKSDA